MQIVWILERTFASERFHIFLPGNFDSPFTFAPFHFLIVDRFLPAESYYRR